MNFAKKTAVFFQKHAWSLIFGGVLLVTLGLRLAISDRNSTALPISDDWYHLEWLKTFLTGTPDYGYPFRYHNEHFYAVAPLFTLIAWKLNGLWDIRLETLIYSIVYVAYAAGILAFFLKTTSGGGRFTLCILALVFLALPMSGFRAAWGYLSGFPVAMLAGLVAVHLGVNNRGSWTRVLVAVAAAVTSTASLAGCGCLIALALATVLGIRSLLKRRFEKPEGLLIIALLLCSTLAVFTKPANPGGTLPVPLPVIISAVSRSLAWPSVFAPPAAVLSMLPGVLLALAWWRQPAMRTPMTEAILAMHLFLALQAAGVAVFRGENNNMAMPSNRYYDILLITPFMAAAACCVLLRNAPGKLAPRVASWGLMLVLAGGASIHFFYRIWPYVARENGEWVEATKVDWIRKSLAEDWKEPVLELDGADSNETEVAMPQQMSLVKKWVESNGSDPLLPATMITGHPLVPEESGCFIRNGIHKAYAGRPGVQYWGSYNERRSKAEGTFRSAPFTAHGAFLIFDLVVQKKARFSFYKLPGLSLDIVDNGTGERKAILPLLAKSWPSVLRDREAVAVPVTAGREYRVEASDVTPDAWFAFSEPADAGRLGALFLGTVSSGKFLAMAGIMVSATGAFFLAMRRQQTN